MVLGGQEVEGSTAACATKAAPHHDTCKVLDIDLSVPLLVPFGGAGLPDLHGSGVDEPKHRLVTKHY